MEGWIKLHRKISQSAIFSDPDLLRLWILCLTKATHKETSFVIDRQQVNLSPGEFVTGRKSLTDEYNIGLKPRHRKKELSIWRDLKFLEECGNLNINATNKYSVITITKWSEYQESEQQMNNNRTTDEQQVNTNKNVKNEKNKERDSRPKPTKPVYDIESPPYILSQFYLTKIREFKPDFKQPNLQSWSDDIRKLIELDKRDRGEIGQVIKWVTKDLFWQGNAQCPAKLREKWDMITTRMKNEGVTFRQSNKNVVQLPTVTVSDEEREHLAWVTRQQAERNLSAANGK